MSTTLNDGLESLKAHMEDLEEHLNALSIGRKISGPRARSSLQMIKNQSQDLRKSITEHVKSLPTRKKVQKPKDVEEPKPVESVTVAAPMPSPKKKAKTAKSVKIAPVAVEPVAVVAAPKPAKRGRPRKAAQV